MSNKQKLDPRRWQVRERDLADYNRAISRACAEPGTLRRVEPGWYLIVLNGQLIEIVKRPFNDEAFPGFWEAHDVDGQWHLEPRPTYQELIDQIRVSDTERIESA